MFVVDRSEYLMAAYRPCCHVPVVIVVVIVVDRSAYLMAVYRPRCHVPVVIVDVMYL